MAVVVGDTRDGGVAANGRLKINTQLRVLTSFNYARMATTVGDKVP